MMWECEGVQEIFLVGSGSGFNQNTLHTCMTFSGDKEKQNIIFKSFFQGCFKRECVFSAAIFSALKPSARERAKACGTAPDPRSL